MTAPGTTTADPNRLGNDRASHKMMQSTFKDMCKHEKSEARASKAVEKAEKAVKKLEKHKAETHKSLRAATHKHDTAVTNLHSGQADLYAKQQEAEKLKQDLANARLRVDRVSNARDVDG